MKTSRFLKVISAVLLGICLVYVAGCTVSKNPKDPFESMNRKIFAFNVVVDGLTVRPLAIVYTTLTPQFFRTGMSNALSNVQQVPTIANNLLQGNLGSALRNMWRLILNSSIGVGGLFDVATKMGLPVNHQDFGLTLAKWGAPKSPYLMLPLIGPSTFREAFAYCIN